MLPTSMMLVFTFVFTRAVDVFSTRELHAPYALYALCGLVPWTFFSTSLGGCVNCLTANRNLVTKVYFPREVFPISCVITAMVDFVLATIVLAVLILYFHVSGRWTFQPSLALLWLPILMVIQIALTVGLGMVLAMANLYYRDVKQITGIMLQLWMFVSAVVVPLPQDGTLLVRVLRLNPLVPLIEGYRECVLFGRMPSGHEVFLTAGVAAFVLMGGWAWFRRASARCAERI